MSKEKKFSAEQRAAAVIISLGAEKAAKIFKHLSETEVEKLSVAVAKYRGVSYEETEDILDDFHKLCITQKIVAEGGIDYARTILEKTYDQQSAQALLERVSKSLKTRAFDFIRKSDTKNLFTILQHERPQTIALVLSYADSDQAAGVIAELPEIKRLKVVEAIARMESASPEAIKLVEVQMKKKFASVMTTDFTKIGGIDYIAEVMNHMDRSNERYIFDELHKIDHELSDEIKKKMFVFEDIISLDARAIQRFIRECELKDLVLAIKGSNKEVSGVLFANMSKRMVETVESELEITVNVRIKDVEEAQQRIVGIIRRLEDQGELVIIKGGKDEIIA